MTFKSLSLFVVLLIASVSPAQVFKVTDLGLNVGQQALTSLGR